MWYIIKIYFTNLFTWGLQQWLQVTMGEVRQGRIDGTSNSILKCLRVKLLKQTYMVSWANAEKKDLNRPRINMWIMFNNLISWCLPSTQYESLHVALEINLKIMSHEFDGRMKLLPKYQLKWLPNLSMFDVAQIHSNEVSQTSTERLNWHACASRHLKYLHLRVCTQRFTSDTAETVVSANTHIFGYSSVMDHRLNFDIIISTYFKHTVNMILRHFASVTGLRISNKTFHSVIVIKYQLYRIRTSWQPFIECLFAVLSWLPT